MANTKISALIANTNPNGSEEFVYAYNNANGKITLNTMKAFVGGAGITTLNADANIWELDDGIYETTYDLYYKSGEYVPVGKATGVTFKQMIFVVKQSTGQRGFLVFNESNQAGINIAYASFGYSVSSSVGGCFRLKEWDASLDHYSYDVSSGLENPDALSKDSLTQVLNEISGSKTLSLSSQNTPYVGVTYTIIVNSVKSGDTYSLTLDTGITNPFGFTLPSSSNKKCVITIVPTSTTTAIVTGCTIAS